ncbi:MAG: hypothetical protein ACRCYE_01415 [Sarcina sp.]
MVDRKTLVEVNKFAKKFDYKVHTEDNNIYLSKLGFRYTMSYNEVSKEIMNDDFSVKSGRLYSTLRRKLENESYSNSVTIISFWSGVVLLLIGFLIVYSSGFDNTNEVMLSIALWIIGILLLFVGLLRYI